MQRGAEIVEAAGCTGATDELACLRALPAETLVRAGAEGTVSGLGLPEFRPNIDGVVLTVDAFDAFRRGERDVPLMIGSNADEATIFTLSIPVPTEAAYETAARAFLGDLADEVMLIYPVSDYPTPKAAFNQAYGEIGFVCPAVAMAAAAAGGAEPAYAYYFTRAPTGTYALLGAFHGIELMFVFGNFPAGVYTPTAGDLALSASVQAAWTGFARDGVPVTTPAWPAHTTAAPALAVLDEPITIANEIVSGRCAALAALGLIPTP
jgi:para-nitrobenzyl esterase